MHSLNDKWIKQPQNKHCFLTFSILVSRGIYLSQNQKGTASNSQLDPNLLRILSILSSHRKRQPTDLSATHHIPPSCHYPISTDLCIYLLTPFSLLPYSPQLQSNLPPTLCLHQAEKNTPVCWPSPLKWFHKSWWYPHISLVNHPPVPLHLLKSPTAHIPYLQSPYSVEKKKGNK